MAHPRTPTALRIVQGGGKLRSKFKERAKREPHGQLGLPPPPAHLNEEQRSIWERIDAAAPPTLLETNDAELLEGYVLLIQSRNQAARMFNQTGAMVLIKSDASKGAFIVNPYLKEIRRLTETLRLLQGELGFSPAARTRIAVEPEGEDAPPGALPGAPYRRGKSLTFGC